MYKKLFLVTWLYCLLIEYPFLEFVKKIEPNIATSNVKPTTNIYKGYFKKSNKPIRCIIYFLFKLSA